MLKPKLEIDYIPEECHALAWDVLQAPSLLTDPRLRGDDGILVVLVRKTGEGL